MDTAIMLTLVGSFAILCTTHVGLAVALTLRKPRWKGLLALLLIPLAPYLGHTARLKHWVTLWVTSFCVYVLALVAAVMGSP